MRKINDLNGKDCIQGSLTLFKLGYSKERVLNKNKLWVYYKCLLRSFYGNKTLIFIKSYYKIILTDASTSTRTNPVMATVI